MPLPSSGPISADDLNDELGNPPGTSIDFETAANALLANPSRPHGMDEFYGASAGYNFTFPDWNGVVSITEFGLISATVGNAASRTINTSNFGVVTSSTPRTVSITIVAPSTFNGQPVDNAGQSLTGNKSATQPAVGRYLELTANDYSLTGQETQVSLTINDLYYTDTTWTLSDTPTFGTNGLELAAYTNTGTGDTTRTLFLNQNTSGTERRTTFTVTGNIGGKTDSIEVSQTSYTPVFAPQFTPSPTSLEWTYSQSGTGARKTLTATRTGGSTSTAVSFYLSGTYYGLIQIDSNVPVNVTGGPWIAEATNDGVGTFSVDVYPLTTNSGGSDKVENLTINMGNAGGTTSINVPLTQTYNVVTYYIFEQCITGTLVMTSNVTPYTSQRAFDSSGNFYFYTNSTTTNGSQHTIRSLTLQAATGCPPVYISWLAEDNSTGATARLTPYPGGYAINDEVYANNTCYTILGESESAGQYTITGACPAPTTPGYNCVSGTCVYVSDNAQYSTLAACQSNCTPTLYNFQGSVSANSFIACSNATIRPRSYQSTNSSGLISGATIYTGVGALLTNATFISDGDVYGTTDSSGIFTEVGGCA
jgi:hypothetical protein